VFCFNSEIDRKCNIVTFSTPVDDKSSLNASPEGIDNSISEEHLLDLLSDDDVEFYSTQAGKPFYFNPVSTEWQATLCTSLGLSFTPSNLSYPSANNVSWQSVPNAMTTVSSDGNCFYRCLSVAVTGHAGAHRFLREKVSKHFAEKPARYSTFADGGVERYLNGKYAMHKVSNWSSKLDMAVAADFLKINIFVFCPVSSNWSPVYSFSNCEPRCPSIYLNHTNGNHFDFIHSLL
jgi:OTU-like cysteine protease